MEKIIFNYHPITHEYIVTEEPQYADLDPKNPDSWILPAHCTEIAPPATGDHQAAVFTAGEWSLVPDYRGETWYKPDRTPVEITELGVEPDQTWTVEPAPPTVPEQIAAQLNTINADCELGIAQISAGYPVSEVLSWPKQETEARAYTADNQAVTPLLDSLSAARGISKAELAGRIIAKADLFAQLSGAIIGKRQGLEDQLDAIADGLAPEDLEAPITPAVQALLDDIKWDAEL